MLTKDALKSLAQAAAITEDIPWELIYAVCLTESSGNEFAIRHEARYRWLLGDNLTAGEYIGQKTSWGLMQVMGAVAREYGFTDQFPALWDPATGIKYGVKHLRRLYAKHGKWPQTIAAYNAGTPQLIDGKFKNQAYVDKVLAYWSEIESHVALKSSEV